MKTTSIDHPLFIYDPMTHDIYDEYECRKMLQNFIDSHTEPTKSLSTETEFCFWLWIIFLLNSLERPLNGLVTTCCPSWNK